DVELPLSEHLEELRRRLVRSLLATAVAFAFCYPQAEFFFDLLTAPLIAASTDTGITATLIGTGVAEAFFTRLKVAFIASVFVALPVILYQIWLFVLPALRARELGYVRSFVVFGSGFFAAGGVFCYRVVLPIGIPFFLSEYTRIGVEPTLRISEYMSFAARMILAFGITFEMPIATFFLARMGLVTHTTLIGASRYAVLVLFILAAILTPPDVVSQLLMAVPLLILYGISIGVAWVSSRDKRSGRDSL
ncbi:MAG: twin-arginine translocase subunit TatC, partial [Candidatus Binatia bacterium]